MSYGDVRYTISRGAIIDRGSGGRFEGTIIDNLSQGPPVYFIHKIFGGCLVQARGVLWGHADIADSGGINDATNCHHSLGGVESAGRTLRLLQK